MKKTAAAISLIVVTIGAATIVPPVFSMMVAAADAPEPVEAAGLGDAIRRQFWSAIDVPLPPLRTAIRSYEIYPRRSFIVRVDVYDVAFGPVPRPALVLAPCWKPGQAFAGGWVDNPSAEADLRAEFTTASEWCSNDGVSRGVFGASSPPSRPG